MSKQIYHAKVAAEWQHPFVDADEQKRRQTPGGGWISYRYLHGGFEGTGVKFSFCFPEKESFTGRFFHYLSPFPGPNEEMASVEKQGEEDIIAFCLLHGAYFVETNMGSTGMFDGAQDATIVWKSSAAAAEYSRHKAMEIYGCSRPFGYVFGGSGGAYKTMACIENTEAWEGAVPYVIGSPVSLPNTITMHAQGQRVLRHVFPRIVDALDAGGSGNPYEKLNDEEAAMLRELTRMGTDPRVWYVEANGVINDGSLPVLTPTVKMIDPSYFSDFWTVPGYLGSDPNSSAVQDRLKFKGRVRCVHVPGATQEKKTIDDRNGVDTAWQKALADGNGAWIELEDVPQGNDLYLHGVTIHINSGKNTGKQLPLGDMIGNCLTIGMGFGSENLGEILSGLKPGDEVLLDNSDYIAVQSYYRHQVPEDLSFHAWDQFRDADGKPALPQRSMMLGYGFTGTGTVQDGNIQGKVIVIQSLMDESTCPWCADWYRKKVREAKGSEQDFRLYYMDRCMHGDVTAMENNMVVNYLGALRQALLDLSDWVERGIEPLPTTVYCYEDGQIIPAETADERKGVQAVVGLTANGNVCAHVKAGETVLFRAEATVPQGAGKVTGLCFGFEDNRVLPGGMSADYPETAELHYGEKNGCAHAWAETSHVYQTPGTYFAAVRVCSQRDGDAEDVFTQVKNLARARIVVE